MITIDATQSLVPDATLLKIETLLQPELANMRQAITVEYTDDRASLSLPDDTTLLEKVEALTAKYSPADLVIVVGIGGSNLGTIAVYEALNGKLGSDSSQPNVLFADTVDPRVAQRQAAILSTALKAGQRVVINVISKSGTTAETVANTAHFLDILAQYNVAPESVVVFTTDQDSKLWRYATKHQFDCLAIPAKVGGRYSVLSAVGLFPLALLGVDIRAFQSGAREMRDRCLNGDLANNPAALSAAVLAAQLEAGHPIHDTFLFAVDLESIGKWYRQLMGESIGKMHDRKGNTVHVGMTPTVSVGSNDLHSVVQLYLGGPNDKVTTFIRTAPLPEPVVSTLPEFTSLANSIEGKSFAVIMDAILDGTLIAYKNAERSYLTITLPELSAANLGALLQLKMQEMMMLGALLDVNPFDQPAVEQYKVETQRILAAA